MGTSGIIHNSPLFFLNFTDQMQNWVEDGIWELTVLATISQILKIYPVILKFIEKKKEDLAT